jgi:hypothetical protein
MTTAPQVKPTHQAVKTYYTALATYADQSVDHEGALLDQGVRRCSMFAIPHCEAHYDHAQAHLGME